MSTKKLNELSNGIVKSANPTDSGEVIDINFGGETAPGMATPINPTDGANKQYVDNNIGNGNVTTPVNFVNSFNLVSTVAGGKEIFEQQGIPASLVLTNQTAAANAQTSANSALALAQSLNIHDSIGKNTIDLSASNTVFPLIPDIELETGNRVNISFVTTGNVGAEFFQPAIDVTNYGSSLNNLGVTINKREIRIIGGATGDALGSYSQSVALGEFTPVASRNLIFLPIDPSTAPTTVPALTNNYQFENSTTKQGSRWELCIAIAANNGVGDNFINIIELTFKQISDQTLWYEWVYDKIVN